MDLKIFYFHATIYFFKIRNKINKINKIDNIFVVSDMGNVKGRLTL